MTWGQAVYERDGGGVGGGGDKEGGRETETVRQTDRQVDIQTDKHTNTLTERQCSDFTDQFYTELNYYWQPKWAHSA